MKYEVCSVLYTCVSVLVYRCMDRWMCHFISKEEELRELLGFEPDILVIKKTEVFWTYGR